MKNIFSTLKNSIVRDEETKRARRANRKAIAELRAFSDNQLKDIGIDRSSITHSVIHGLPERAQSKRAA